MPLKSVGGGGIFNGRSRRRASDLGTLHTLDVAGIVGAVSSARHQVTLETVVTPVG